jgi:hypothetical protein
MVPSAREAATLDRVDRIQLAVRDRAAAARTFVALLGACPAREAA